LRQLRELLPLVDGGAASPKETWLRLLFIDAGLPRPTTQIPVVDERGRLVRMLDMGWEDFMVGAEYDGDQHRTNRKQYVKDLRVWPKLERMGWNVTRRDQGGSRGRHHRPHVVGDGVPRLETLASLSDSHRRTPKRRFCWGSLVLLLQKVPLGAGVA
jgi:hypothetical protein